MEMEQLGNHICFSKEQLSSINRMNVKKKKKEIVVSEKENEWIRVPLNILCCPKCKSDLELNDKKLECKVCNVFYKIEQNGVPVLLTSQAKKLIPA